MRLSRAWPPGPTVHLKLAVAVVLFVVGAGTVLLNIRHIRPGAASVLGADSITLAVIIYIWERRDRQHDRRKVEERHIVETITANSGPNPVVSLLEVRQSRARHASQARRG